MQITKVLLRYWKISALILIIGIFVGLDNPQLFCQVNKQVPAKSVSVGSENNGSLLNGVKLPYNGINYKYFSTISYYMLNRAYVNAKVYNTIVWSYKECETTCSGIYFRIMESSKRKGGKMWPHRTHQNGLSVDFMTPLKKGNHQYRLLDKVGLWHYLLNFDESGKFNKNVEIDFNSLAKHIIALDNAATKNGLRIRKVIFKLNLKDELFSTESGKAIKKKGIYFAQQLPEMINNLHDDHYHVDFEEIK